MKAAEELRSEQVAVYLTPSEKQTARRLAEPTPLGAWIYRLIKAAMEERTREE